MAMIQYPAELPLPLQDGYGYETVDPMRSTPMVTGRRRYRKVHSYVPSTMTFNFVFEEAEAAFFEAWYARTLNDGLEWFEMPLQLPAGFGKYQVHFVGIYGRTELTQVSRWRYSISAELKQRPLIPDGWEQFPEYWFNKGVIDVAINRNWPEMIFDYPSYAAAQAALLSLRDGAVVTIESDETQGGNSSSYRVLRADLPSLSLDFLSQQYAVGSSVDALQLVVTYAN